MVVKKPKTDYEKLIYNKISTEKYYATSEGEKAILYDLAIIYIPKYAHIDFKYTDIDFYLHTIKRVYDKRKNTEQINVICECINALFQNKKAHIEGGMEERQIIVEDISISKP